MLRPGSILFIIMCFLALNAQAGLPTAIGGTPLPSLAPMLEQTTPAVVNIAARGTVVVRENPLLSDPFFRRFFNVPDRPRKRHTQSLGSGVIVDAAEGYILTNNHVIQHAQEISVTLRDGRRFAAKLVGTDPDTDVAVIRIAAENLSALPLANSDGLRVGDFVVAIGNPFGLGQTVTSGIVSALGRSGLGIGGFEDFIQTDASINVGNSGGALVNLRGELVGINSAIFARGGGSIGIGFAIPSNMARDIMTQLVTFGEVRRGLLGASAQDLTPALAEAFGIAETEGAVVVEVADGSPANKAGLKPGDIVTRVNRRPIRSASDVRNAIALLRVGQTVQLEILRNTKMLNLQAMITENRQQMVSGDNFHPRLSGAAFADIVEGSPLYGKLEGVVVLDVEANAPAARSGLRKGDIVTAVNRTRIRSMKEFQHLARKGGDALVLNVRRGRGSVFILIR